MNPFTKIQLLNIKNLPTQWIVVGDPRRARDIAHLHFKCPSPVYQDGYMSVWVSRQPMYFGIISTGMGKVGLQYASNRVNIESAVRIGTCGYYLDEYEMKFVNVQTAIDDFENTLLTSLVSTKYPNVICHTTDYLHLSSNIIADVSDMETYYIFKNIKYSASILLAVNKVGFSSSNNYSNEIFFEVANEAVNILKVHKEIINANDRLRPN